MRTDEELDAATVDDLAELYNVELRATADRFAPERSVTVRREPRIRGLTTSVSPRSALCVPLNVSPVVLTHQLTLLSGDCCVDAIVLCDRPSVRRSGVKRLKPLVVVRE